MSKSIGGGCPVVDRAGSAPGQDNDRGPRDRQARPRRALPRPDRRSPAAVIAILTLALSVAFGAVAAEAAEEADRPLEIERQQIGGRLGTIERKEEDRGRLPVPGSRLDPYEPAPAPSESRGARKRLDLERRTLESRREGLDRDLDRGGPGTNPSSSGLLDRLRRN